MSQKEFRIGGLAMVVVKKNNFTRPSTHRPNLGRVFKVDDIIEVPAGQTLIVGNCGHNGDVTVPILGPAKMLMSNGEGFSWTAMYNNERVFYLSDYISASSCIPLDDDDVNSEFESKKELETQ